MTTNNSRKIYAKASRRKKGWSSVPSIGYHWWTESISKKKKKKKQTILNLEQSLCKLYSSINIFERLKIHSVAAVHLGKNLVTFRDRADSNVQRWCSLWIVKIAMDAPLRGLIPILAWYYLSTERKELKLPSLMCVNFLKSLTVEYTLW